MLWHIVVVSATDNYVSNLIKDSGRGEGNCYSSGWSFCAYIALKISSHISNNLKTVQLPNVHVLLLLYMYVHFLS